ncbi:hypothetical protein EGR95_01065, partial [bacterium]|nr:hypothetical protein [bacterium]
MTVKKDPKRQLLGKIAKARGKQFESRIDDSFAYYAQKGFAIIEKTPEPMHPTKNLGNGKFIAYYEKQAQPDYKGTIKGGRTVMFEAKFTAADRMEQSRVLQSQQDYMDRHQALGARCFVIAGFSSGMVYCADCGAKMCYCTTNYFEKRQDHFVCANYRSNTGSCSAHFIRAVVLEELVWMHMRTVISYVSRYEDHFRAVMEQKLRLSSEAAIRGHKKRLAQAEKRLGELDRLFIRIYEANVAERITDERFSMMSKTYEDEQAQLKEEIQTLRQEIEVQERQIE